MSASRVPVHKALDETLAQLVERWLKVPSTTDYEKPVDQSPQQIAERIVRRAEAMIKLLKIDEPQVTPSYRWRNLWNPEKPTKILRDKLKQLGWTVLFVEMPKQLSSQSMMNSSGGDTFFLEQPAADAIAHAVQEAGFPAPFDGQDAVPILLARELYDIAAPQLGHPPKEPWVDDLARELVAQRLVGLPFNPMALTII